MGLDLPVKLQTKRTVQIDVGNDHKSEDTNTD